MTAPSPSGPRPGHTTRLVLVALAVAGLVLVGLAAWAASRPAYYGWFAYAPMSETTYLPAGAVAPGTAAWLAAAGALLLGGVAGFLVGRRGRPLDDARAAGVAPE